MQLMKCRRIECVVLLGLAVAAWCLLPRALSENWGADLVSWAGPWAPALFIGGYAAFTVAGFPGSLLTVAGGALFGAPAGALWSLLGATLGAVAAFLISSHLFSGWVRERAGSVATRVIAGVEASGWRFVAMVRLVPLIPFNAVNYALGLTRIGLAPYTLWTFVCMVPGALACALLGQGGVEAAKGDGSFVRTLSLALGILVVAALLPGTLRRFSRAWGKPPQAPKGAAGRLETRRV